jgi:hypothetical protein
MELPWVPFQEFGEKLPSLTSQHPALELPPKVLS